MQRLATVVVLMTLFAFKAQSQNTDTHMRPGTRELLNGNADALKEVSATPGWGSRADSIPRRIDWARAGEFKKPFPVQSFILPAAMIAYGAVAVHNNNLKNINANVKDEIWSDHPHAPMHLDNYLMFAPTVAVYALNAAGIHGKNNFRDRTMILLMANAFANGTVFTVKSWAHEQRPDGSDYNSFPSGHTAEAFAGAEFLRMEYKDVSPWYGVAGYAMATATGMLRMYNDKHWVSDVVTGAGVGIASTRLAYWLYPTIKKLLFKDKPSAPLLMPSYSNGSVGLVFAYHF